MQVRRPPVGLRVFHQACSVANYQKSAELFLDDPSLSSGVARRIVETEVKNLDEVFGPRFSGTENDEFSRYNFHCLQ